MLGFSLRGMKIKELKRHNFLGITYMAIETDKGYDFSDLDFHQ